MYSTQPQRAQAPLGGALGVAGGSARRGCGDAPWTMPKQAICQYPAHTAGSLGRETWMDGWTRGDL